LASFDIGNVYSDVTLNTKTYYVAVTCSTLVTYKNESFIQYTTKRRGHSLENLSVRNLCKKWNISVQDLDHHMYKYFGPDEDAIDRARRDKFAKAEEQQALELNNAD